MKSLSFKIEIIFFSIWLFVFNGYLETFGAEWIYSCENPSPHCYFDQQNMAYALKNIVRGWIKTVDKEKFIIEIAGRFGHRKTFPEPENLKMILLIFIGVWGIAIFFVLGVILYRIIIEPAIEKIKLKQSESKQEQINQNH
jgi:hypothetical protein